MRNAILIISLIFCFAAKAEWSTADKIETVRYSSKASCERANPAKVCLDYTGKDPRFHKVETVSVDDLEKPIYKPKYNVTACDDAADCGEKIDALNLAEGDHTSYCDEDAGDKKDMVTFSENSLMPGWSFYCTSITGYEQKQVQGLVVDESLKAQVEAADQALKAKQAAKDLIEKNINFSKDLKKEISIINLSRGLTSPQIQQFVDAFESVNRLLDAGAVKTARVAIVGLVPDEVLLRAADKTKILAMIDAHLAENPQ